MIPYCCALFQNLISTIEFSSRCAHHCSVVQSAYATDLWVRLCARTVDIANSNSNNFITSTGKQIIQQNCIRGYVGDPPQLPVFLVVAVPWRGAWPAPVDAVPAAVGSRLDRVVNSASNRYNTEVAISNTQGQRELKRQLLHKRLLTQESQRRRRFNACERSTDTPDSYSFFHWQMQIDTHNYKI